MSKFVLTELFIKKYGINQKVRKEKENLFLKNRMGLAKIPRSVPFLPFDRGAIGAALFR